VTRRRWVGGEGGGRRQGIAIMEGAGEEEHSSQEGEKIAIWRRKRESELSDRKSPRPWGRLLLEEENGSHER